jgi:AcrR family transcriptional regulator
MVRRNVSSDSLKSVRERCNPLNWSAYVPNYATQLDGADRAGPGSAVSLERASRPVLDPGIHAAFRHIRITDAIAELCVEQGYRATTIQNVARRAQASRATIYAQFESREEIFLAALDRGVAELLERTEGACAEADEGQRIEAGLAAALQWIAAEPAIAWVCFVEALRGTPESARHYIDACSRFASLLHDAAPAEVSRPRTTEESLVGGVASLLSGRIRAGESQRAPDLLPELTVFLRGPFLAL